MTSDTQKSFHSTTYRADIDGLRAVAVIMVLLFHGFPEFFSGGFIGVDVFFVISGFLISKIILEKIESDTFSFLDFYSRRIRRIFPALVLVLIPGLIFGWFALLDFEYANLGWHALGAASFSSNIMLWREAGYFDTASNLKPLLHLWSLGVEEQFYILWPFTVWTAVTRKVKLQHTILVIGTLSFTLWLIGSHHNPLGAFYFPVTRFWQLLAGAYLAASIQSKNQMAASTSQFLNFVRRSQPYFSVLGLGLLGVSFFLINNERYFGPWATLPTLGTSLILWGNQKPNFVKSLLSHQGLVWVGLISYPLYLWHWPLLSFTNIVVGNPSFLLRGLLLALSFPLAWFTYAFIENPLRFGQYLRFKTIVLCLVLFSIGFFGFLTLKSKGFPSRYTASENDYSIRGDAFIGPNKVVCEEYGVPTKDPTYCAIAQQPRFIIFGDSHAAHFYYGFSKTEFADSTSVIARVGCTPPTKSKCKDLLEYAMKYISKNKSIEFVIVNGWGNVIEASSNETREQMLNEYVGIIKRVQSFNKKVIFVEDNQTLLQSSEICSPAPLTLRMALRHYPSFCSTLTKSDFIEYKAYELWLEKLKKSVKDVTFFDAKSVICQDSNCRLYKDSKLLYADEHHFSIYGSVLLVESLLRQLNLVAPVE